MLPTVAPPVPAGVDLAVVGRSRAQDGVRVQGEGRRQGLLRLLRGRALRGGAVTAVLELPPVHVGDAQHGHGQLRRVVRRRDGGVRAEARVGGQRRRGQGKVVVGRDHGRAGGQQASGSRYKQLLLRYIVLT